ncbi:MAG TPA: Maf family protein [Thermoanaerobaculia bacterium]|nr:Maf family protein [Thermoanaerobaculia bacterium]
MITPPVPSLILASSSPRRRDLLAGLGLRFAVRPVEVDETPAPGEEARPYVLRLAKEKAAARLEPGELVLAADTVVVLDGELLGKPADEAEARAMLARLAGREHTVMTGIALADGSDGARTAVEASRVRIAPMSAEEIAWYVATGETLDKAGSYAAQGIGAIFVAGIAGDYTNVVGLPLPATYRLFREAGHDLREFRR